MNCAGFLSLTHVWRKHQWFHWTHWDGTQNTSISHGPRSLLMNMALSTLRTIFLGEEQTRNVTIKIRRFPPGRSFLLNCSAILRRPERVNCRLLHFLCRRTKAFVEELDMDFHKSSHESTPCPYCWTVRFTARVHAVSWWWPFCQHVFLQAMNRNHDR